MSSLIKIRVFVYIISLLLFLLTDQCPAGKFSADGLGPLCRVCPKDSYQDQPGMTACKKCASGTETLQLAATSPNDCGGKDVFHS